MPSPRPPSADPLVALADQCVQCGLCLPACPTYRRDRNEAESPRGRIAVARAWALHALEPTAAGDAHLDNCLACRNCEAVCPAGVRYGALLVETRRRQRLRRAAHVRQRLLEWLTMRPVALSIALAGYRALWPLLPTGLRRLPRPPPRPMDAGTPAIPGSREDSARPIAALFVGCVADAYEPSTRASLVLLMEACGIDLRTPAGQACCGTLHAHAGDEPKSAALAARNVRAFDGARHVLTLASGCHAAVASALAPRVPVSDALDVLATHLGHLRFRRCDERIAVHVACTQRNAVRSVASLRALLAAVPGLDIVTLDAGYGCCGAAGTAMLTDAMRAADFRTPLLAQLAATGATRLLSANIGCRLHLANAARVPVLHPVDFLAACLDTSR